MKQETQLTKSQEASMNQVGSDDIVLNALIKHKIPVTRENYLGLAYFGNVPEELTAEQEAELPEKLRNK